MLRLISRWDANRWPLLLASLTLVVLLAFLGSCRTAETRDGEPKIATLEEAMKLLEDRPAWARHDRELDLSRHPAEKYLADWVIVLDPGHGGLADRAGYKRGPTGVREAEMNLRVGLLLKELLQQAGATVILTRESETSEAADDRLGDTHARRAAVANTVRRPDGGTGADLFISLHHNAASNPDSNYTTVWFHGEAAWSEPALDAARTIGHRLGESLRTDVGLTGLLMSDQQMYASGFAVLRRAEVPAILLESSFFTQPEEEQRLRDARYNLREAYAIYEGLCELAYGGRPTQSTPRPLETHGEGQENASSRSAVTFVSNLDDGLPAGWWGGDRNRILPSTITVTLDGRRLDHRFDPASKALTFELPPSLEGGTLAVHHANLYKHHNFPQRYRLERTDDAAWKVNPLGQRRSR